MEKESGAISIRRATRADADSLASILSESFAEYEPLYTPEGYAATTPAVEQLRARWQEGPVWVVVRGLAVVGTVSAVPR